MKKKLFLIVAIIMVAVISCAMLVACKKKDDNNETKIAASPTEFAEQWKNSDSRYLNNEFENAIITLNKNICKSESEGYKVIYEVPAKNQLNSYTMRGTTWTKKSFTEIEDILYEYKYQLNGYTELNDAMPFMNTVNIYFEYFKLAEFEKNCVKNENTYTGNANTVYQNVIITISEKELVINFPDNFSLDEIPDAEEEFEMAKLIFGLGSDTISIPEEAKQCQDVTIKRTIEKAIDKIKNQSNIIVTDRDEVLSKCNNIIKVENSEHIVYIEEKENNTYDYYLLDIWNNPDNTEWVVKNLDKQGLLDTMREDNVFNFNDFKNFDNLFESMLSWSQILNIRNIDEYFTLGQNNIYVGKDYYEFFTIKLAENKVTMERHSESDETQIVEKYEIALCESIVIPQEAKDAFAN